MLYTYFIEKLTGLQGLIINNIESNEKEVHIHCELKRKPHKCPNCGETVLTHTVCTACGTYKGKPVSLKDRVEEVAEEKKSAKKSAKKAEKVEEVKAEEAPAEEKTEE